MNILRSSFGWEKNLLCVLTQSKNYEYRAGSSQISASRVCLDLMLWQGLSFNQIFQERNKVDFFVFQQLMSGETEREGFLRWADLQFGIGFTNSISIPTVFCWEFSNIPTRIICDLLNYVEKMCWLLSCVTAPVMKIKFPNKTRLRKI